MGGQHALQGDQTVASHFGGTRNPMVGTMACQDQAGRNSAAQFHHVNDVVPTIYEVVGITPPRVVNGIPQDPIDGVKLRLHVR